MSSVLKAWCTLSPQQSYNYQIYNFYELKNLITAEWFDGIHHRRKRSCMKGVITNIADSPILPKVVPFLFISNQGYSYYSLVQYYKPLLYIYIFFTDFIPLKLIKQTKPQTLKSFLMFWQSFSQSICTFSVTYSTADFHLFSFMPGMKKLTTTWRPRMNKSLTWQQKGLGQWDHLVLSVPNRAIWFRIFFYRQ